MHARGDFSLGASQPRKRAHESVRPGGARVCFTFFFFSVSRESVNGGSALRLAGKRRFPWRIALGRKCPRHQVACFSKHAPQVSTLRTKGNVIDIGITEKEIPNGFSSTKPRNIPESKCKHWVRSIRRTPPRGIAAKCHSRNELFVNRHGNRRLMQLIVKVWVVPARERDRPVSLLTIYKLIKLPRRSDDTWFLQAERERRNGI